MIINKPFKTYRQQLRILRERNLQIPNGHKAMKILKRENYYSVINGYKDNTIVISLILDTTQMFIKTGLHLTTFMLYIVLTEICDP